MRAACKRRNPLSWTLQAQRDDTRSPSAPVRSSNPVPPQTGQGSFIRASRSSRSSESVEVAPELLAFLGAVQLVQGLGLDLPDPLAGEVHHLSDLLERLRVLAVQAEP